MSSPAIPDRSAIESASDDHERLHAILALASELRDRDLHECFALARQGADLAKKLGDRDRMAEGLRLMGQASWKLGKFKVASRLLKRARRIWEELDNKV